MKECPVCGGHMIERERFQPSGGSITDMVCSQCRYEEEKCKNDSC